MKHRRLFIKALIESLKTIIALSVMILVLHVIAVLIEYFFGEFITAMCFAATIILVIVIGTYKEIKKQSNEHK